MTNRVSPERILPLVSTLAMVLLLPGGCQRKISTDSIDFVTPARMGEQIAKDPSKHLILDARPAEAFMEGRIPGAQRISLPEIDTAKLNPEWERYSSIVVYGDNPGSLAAEAVTKRLMSIGYERVYLLDGGFDAWKAGGRPIQR